MKKLWKILAGVVGIVLGIIFFRRQIAKEFLAKLLSKEAAVKDAVLDEKRKVLKEERVNLEEAKKAIEDRLNQPAPELSPKEIEDFYNKKLK